MHLEAMAYPKVNCMVAQVNQSLLQPVQQSMESSLALVPNINQSHWQQVIRHIETKLKQDEAYQRVLYHWHTIAGETTDEAVAYLHVLLQRAIRMTLHQAQSHLYCMAQHHSTEPCFQTCSHSYMVDAKDSTAEVLETSLPDVSLPDVSLPDVSLPDVSASLPNVSASLPDASLPDASLPNVSTSLPDASLPDASLPALGLPDSTQPAIAQLPQQPSTTTGTAEQSGAHKPSLPILSRLVGNRKAVEVTQSSEPHPLYQIGQELQQLRLARSISLEKLHYLTLVPIYHLKALEDGQVEQLPELVYLRGFLQRICDALGLGSDRWLTKIAALEESQSFLPSWQPLKPGAANVYLSPLHLYLGYATLMAGAVGGLLLNNQATLHELPAGLLSPSPQPSIDLPQTPSTTGNNVTVRPYASVALPEVLP